MKIEIEYNGSLAACKVDGKPFNECGVNEQVFAMDAFRTIVKDWNRKKLQRLQTLILICVRIKMVIRTSKIWKPYTAN